MLLAVEYDPVVRGGIIGGIAALVPVLAAAGVMAFNAWKSRRADALAEWQKIAEDHKRRLDKAEERILALMAREANCLVEVAELRAQLRITDGEVRRVQEKTGTTAPGVISPVVITADLSGRVYAVSPSSGPMFHYLPGELVGRNIDLIIPERLRPDHHAALARLRQEDRDPDPSKPLLTFGRTKEGDEVPVLINLSGWKDTGGTRYVTAEIRRREGVPPVKISDGGPAAGSSG